MKKNDLIKIDIGIYRILSLNGDRILVIDCAKKTMPKFFPVSSLGNVELPDYLPSVFPDMDDLSPTDRKVALKRYTMIAGAVSVVDDPQQRNLMIEKAARQFGISKQSIRSFLCSYLVYQDMAALAPKQVKEKELTQDQRNMRWALNKFFYTRNQNSLPTAYTMMLKAKYCDAYGVLLPEYLPQVKSVIQQILGHPGRPEKVSFAKVQKALGVPQKQFDKLPKCKAYIEKHIESQPVYWAREVEWAIAELMQEGKPLNTSRIMKKTNMRIHDIECCCPYIKKPDVKSLVSNMLT